jgi:glycosyltransferase involved in cell wall biosynthesis
MRKKVLVIPSWYPSPQNELTGSFFREQAQLMNQEGFDVRVLLAIQQYERPKMSLASSLKRRVPFTSILFPEKNSASINTNVTLDTSVLLQEPVAYSFAVKLLEGVSDEEWYELTTTRYAAAIDQLATTGWLPDIIHAQCCNAAGIVANYLSVRYHIPFVITEHQLFLLHTLSPFRQQLILEALKQASKVAAVSEHQKKCILMHEPDCNPEVILNLVNDYKFPHLLPASKNTFTVVTVTYPNPIKDHSTFLKAMQALAATGINFRFIMIGNDSFHDLSAGNSDVFRRESKELGIEELGVFIPYLKREEMAETINNCDVFVCTSIAETFGVAAREAMLCGLPVVTTACGGVEDSITKETGITVPIRDHKAVADAVLSIKNNPSKYNSDVIRNFIKKQCGAVAFVNKMKVFYEL